MPGPQRHAPDRQRAADPRSRSGGRGGGPAQPTIAEAIRITRLYRSAAGSGAGRGRREEEAPPVPDAKEIFDSLHRRIEDVKREEAQGKLAQGWVQDEAGNWIPPGWVRRESGS